MDSAVRLVSTHSEPLTAFVRPDQLVRSIWRYRDLVQQLTWRNVLGRYRGSSLGLTWSFILPLAMLTIYTFVFGVVFKRAGEESIISFAIKLYAGLLVFALFSETLSAAPALIVGSPNYVKKVVFPLEVLPVCALGAAVFQLLISIVVLLCCSGLFLHRISSTIYLFPLVMLPLAFWTLGLAWFLASLGVYLRDIGQFIGILMQMLMFLSPIFYTLDNVPPAFRTAMRLNPLTTLVQSAQNTLLFGKPPEWIPLAGVTLLSLIVLQLGYVWFMKTRRGFADVL